MKRTRSAIARAKPISCVTHTMVMPSRASPVIVSSTSETISGSYRLLALMPAERIESYGKAAAVGVAGEIEHASAMIHTLRFGNVFRDAVGGTTYLEFCNTRNAPGALLSLPMMHKSENGRRSRFITANFQIADGPAADEIVVAIGAAYGGRLHPRIADRFQDMKEMEQEAAG